jgi:hypothetical protein
MPDELPTIIRIPLLHFVFLSQSVREKHSKSIRPRYIFTEFLGPIQITSNANSYGTPLREPSDLHHLRLLLYLATQRPAPLTVKNYQRIVVISCSGISGSVSGHRKDPADEVIKSFESKVRALVAGCQCTSVRKDGAPLPKSGVSVGRPG